MKSKVLSFLLMTILVISLLSSVASATAESTTPEELAYNATRFFAKVNAAPISKAGVEAIRKATKELDYMICLADGMPKKEKVACEASEKFYKTVELYCLGKKKEAAVYDSIQDMSLGINRASQSQSGISTSDTIKYAERIVWIRKLACGAYRWPAKNVGTRPYTQTEKSTEEDLCGSREDIVLARDEIVARYGQIFKGKTKEYFKRQIWYKENPKFKMSQMTSLERQNYAFYDKWIKKL